MDRAVLIGPPASGKGTQAALLAAAFKAPAMSTGRMLREEEARGTEVGRLATKLARTGSLFPDDQILAMVAEWLERRGPRFIFDGFPRTLPQAAGLEDLLAARSAPLDAAVFIHAPEGVLRARALDRLTCSICGAAVPADAADTDTCPRCGGELVRRTDDSARIFELRMNEFREKTEPVLPFYRERGLLIEIDGDGEPQEVFARVSEALHIPPQ